MDPALKGTQDHSYDVVMDLVRRYDLDGIHFDDYFYPYPDYNNFKDFPDDASWQAYQQGGGKLSRGDWRRDAVNTFIERLYKGIKAEKPWVKFGLSPFGLWQPYNPPAIGGGFNQHETLYADAKLWLNKGWIDYYSPQLYWPINQLNLSYPVLLGWWKEQNLKGRHLWPGINLSNGAAGGTTDETVNKIMVTRGMLPESPGVIHWSIGQLVSSPDMVKAIAVGPYKNKALVPASPWLDKQAPTPPAIILSKEKDSVKVSWSHKTPGDVSRWVAYFKYGSQWKHDIYGPVAGTDIIPGFMVNRTYLDRADPQTVKKVEDVLFKLDTVAISAVDRFGNESALTRMAVTDLTFADAPPLEVILAAYAAKETGACSQTPCCQTWNRCSD